MSQNESANFFDTADISLVNFPFLSEHDLSRLARELSLSMGSLGLRFCQSYYRTQKRDPRIEELRLLDSIVKDGYARPDTLLLSEMTTESDAIADTFADLMTRRSAAQRADKKPLSLATLAGLMEAWLTLHDPEDASPADVGIRFSPYRDLLLAADGYQHTASSGNEDTDISIGVRPHAFAKNTQAPTAGDYVFAVLSPEGADEPFFRTLSGFLSSPAITEVVKSVKIVKKQALLPLLVDMEVGMTVYPERVFKDTDPVSAFVQPVTGALLIASPSLSADLLLEAQDCDLRVCLLAKIGAADTLRVTANGSTMQLHLSFLRSLTFPRLCTATVKAPSDGEADVSLNRIGTCTLNGRRNAVVKVDAHGTASFRAALLGTVYSLSHCVAAGADVTKTKLATALTLSPHRIGDALGAILGLYRAQAELALRGNPPCLTIDKAAETSFSAVTVAPLPAVTPSATAQGKGTKIFYLDPLYTADGIPDFADLKKLYGYVGALIADGKVLSIRPTDEDLLTDLEEMSRDVVVEYIPNTPISSHIGGFLVETNGDIEGILLAKTENPDKCEADS